jgi:F-type H+-transporting ATPase subunit b
MRRFPFLPALGLTVLAQSAFAAGGGGHEEASFTPVIFQGLNLLILLGIIVHYAKAPMRRSLADRAAQVTRDIDEAARLHGEAETRLKEYEAKLASLQKEADELLAEMKREGEHRLITEAQAESERIRAEAERAAENEIARARARLESEVVDLAITAAEQAIRNKLGPADHRRLTADYLGRLEETLRG